MDGQSDYRVLILANRSKPMVVEALEELRPWLAARATIVAEPDVCELSSLNAVDLPHADLSLVLGGDGTMIAQARNMVDLGIPMLGVNFGKLGFLAEFSLSDLKTHWETVVSRRCRATRRLLIDVQVYADGQSDWVDVREPGAEPRFRSLAMNDAVVTAGPPYRMIEMDLAIDPLASEDVATTFSGDGAIVATPSGSTAYNLAAGGPIVTPAIDALCVTPLCPHSLAFRPLVVNAACCVHLRLRQANTGTTLVIDGQVSTNISEGEQVVIRKYPRQLTLIQNPALDYWRMLAKKLHWAARPVSYRSDGE